MKFFKVHFILTIITFLSINSLVAQQRNKEWQVGYFAPYIAHMGGTVGFGVDFKELGDNSTEQRNSKHRLQLLSQLGYFTQINVSHNLLLNPELVYRWYKSDKRFFLTSSLGAGFLLALQRQDGSFNLGTGEMEHRYDALYYFLPTLNLGLGVEPKKHLGFFVKATYGSKLSVQYANTAFVGLSTGLIIKFHPKN